MVETSCLKTPIFNQSFYHIQKSKPSGELKHGDWTPFSIEEYRRYTFTRGACSSQLTRSVTGVIGSPCKIQETHEISSISIHIMYHPCVLNILIHTSRIIQYHETLITLYRRPNFDLSIPVWAVGRCMRNDFPGRVHWKGGIFGPRKVKDWWVNPRFLGVMK